MASHPASCETEPLPDYGVFVGPSGPVKGDTHASHRKNMGDLSLDGRERFTQPPNGVDVQRQLVICEEVPALGMGNQT